MPLSINQSKTREIADFARKLEGNAPRVAEPAMPDALVERPVSDAKPVAASSSRWSEMSGKLARAYQPIANWIVLVLAACFLVLGGVYSAIDGLAGLASIGAIAGIAAGAFVAVHVSQRNHQLGFGALEARVFIVFCMTFCVLFAHQVHDPDPSRLMFFTLAAVLLSVMSVSRRLIAAINLSGLAAILVLVYQAGGDIFWHTGVVGIAGAVSSIAVAMSVRAAIVKEISARMLANELRGSAETIAEWDMVTGLPNRHSFFRELKAKLRGGDSALQISLAIADLDGFKAVNDMYGHVAGDRLLFEASQRIREASGAGSFVARLGGDEFAILTTRLRSHDEMEALGREVQQRVSEPYEVNGIRMSLSLSIGFVSEKYGLTTEREMIERADYALYRAKETKRGVVVYSMRHEAVRKSLAAIEHNLLNCDREAEMSVVFLPQVDVTTGKTLGFEALARWTNSELGHVRPDVFIRAAERTGLIGELTPLLLRIALEQAVLWPEHLRLSFNLSFRDIVSPAAIDAICDAVRGSGIDAGRIDFEVTESLIMSDFEQASHSLRLLRLLGAQVTLDDFGTGYSNFDHIEQLQVKTIKIDRGLVERLGKKNSSARIVNAIIELCANLGVTSVVEGVETKEQLHAIIGSGARYVQGYYFSEPMKGGEIPAYLLQETAQPRLADEASDRKSIAG
jgi:diguanylate cyclase (GGDEF)-like protein